MDFLTDKELNGLKSDIKSSEIALEAEKYSFEKQLKETLGPKMVEELNKPKEIKETKTCKKRKFNILRLFNL